MPMEILAQNPACNPACRACHYKDLSYLEQLQRKQEWTQAQLSPWSNALLPIVPAPEGQRVNYRAKSWLRSRVVGGTLDLGMTKAVFMSPAADSADRRPRWAEAFISWRTCPLHVSGLQQSIARLCEDLPALAPHFVEHSLLGVWAGSPHLVLVSRDALPAELTGVNWRPFVADPFDRVWFHQTSQVGRRVFGHSEIRQLAGPTDTAPSPIRAFRQVARGLLRDARESAVRYLLATTPAQVVDLYCGTGELADFLPSQTDWLGVELSQEAAAFAGAGRRVENRPANRPENRAKERQAETEMSGKIDHHRAFVGTVEHRLRDARFLAQVRDSYALFLNPPRPGLQDGGQASVGGLIDHRRPRAIAYLSCSPSSLARDLQFLGSLGFTVDSLQPYDFLPQTEHVEVLALLSTSKS